MSEVYRLSEDREFWIKDIGEISIDKATKLLAGISGGAPKAIGSAIKRAASSGEAFAARAVRAEYYVSASDFKEYTKSNRHINSTASGTDISIKYHGTHIPLVRFDTHIGRDGRVVTRVSRKNARETMQRAFKANFNGVVGIYERIGEKRFPIRQLYGPATPQMMDANNDVAESIAEHIRETFDKRVDHEITAILNGWRKK